MTKVKRIVYFSLFVFLIYIQHVLALPSLRNFDIWNDDNNAAIKNVSYYSGMRTSNSDSGRFARGTDAWGSGPVAKRVATHRQRTAGYASLPITVTTPRRATTTSMPPPPQPRQSPPQPRQPPPPPRKSMPLLGTQTGVLNFFPVPVEEECNANDGRRKGVCMNTYECRIQGGKSYGFCALGFGVCCVFTATCDQEAFNNITYFVNPDFPDLTKDMTSCSLIVKKIDPEISQLRLDFIHFNLGQPNRRTGVCEEDFFIMSGGDSSRELKLCGLNSGQHAYYDVETMTDPIKITMKLSRKAVSRLWEVRVTQVPFTERAPAGCLQYHFGRTGVVQTMNFADNGRHLADQDYNICMRQEEGMCSIAYEPCHENAFQIGPNNGGDGSATSGEATDPGGTSSEGNPAPAEDFGSGAGPVGAQTRNMDICVDKIVMPCDSEDLIMLDDVDSVPGFCDVVHCGSTLCPSGESPCRIESSFIPFTIGVHFGPSAREESPDDNLGMCLTYEQLPCNV